jgi:hypothetical protein
MSGSIANVADVENDILNYEVADEAVEAAAALLEGQARNATVAFCSGLDTCPSWAVLYWFLAASEAIDLNQSPDAVIGSELAAAFPKWNAVHVKVKLGHRIPCWVAFFRERSKLQPN